MCRRLFGGADYEHESWLEAEKARDVCVWHLLNARVKQIDRVVVKLAPVGNLVFQFTDALVEVNGAPVGPSVFSPPR